MALALDPSTPAVVSVAATTATTASFTPPAGAVLYAIALHATNSAGANRTSTITDSTGLTWTSQATTPLGPAPAPNGSLARIWTAVVVTSQAMTVTSTITSNSYPGSVLRVLVYSGADIAAPVEGAVNGGSTSAVISQSITTSTDGGIPWLGNVDFASGAAPTAGAGTTTDHVSQPNSADRFWIATRAAISPAGSATISSSAPTSGVLNAWVAFAVKPGTASTTANAGVASVSVDAHGPAATTAVTVDAATADVAAVAQPAIAVVPSLFTDQTPSGTDNSDGSPGITTATTERFAIAGHVTAIRFYATTTVGGTYTAALWQVTSDDNPGPGAGTLLASKILGVSPTPGAWNTVTFDTPVAVTPGVLYRAGLHSTDGRYVSTPGLFASDIINGQITADAGGDDPVGLGSLKQGTFEIDAALTYPDDQFNTSAYFVDVVFALDAPTGATASAGVAEVTAAGQSATASVGASAGPAAVAADGHNPSLTLAGTGAAGLAAVTADAYGPAVATAVTAAADVAPVAVAADNASQTVQVNAGQAAATADAYGATAVTSAEGIATAGSAAVAVDAYGATGQPALTVDAGTAQVVVAADNPTVVTEAAMTATAGVAGVDVSGYDALITAEVSAPAGVADVATEAFGALVVAATGAEAEALTALADVDAYNALVAVLVQAGTAEVGVDAYSIPRGRRPGILTAGTRRSRLTAGVLRGPTTGA